MDVAASSQAAMFLVRMGPVAESFLWSALKDTAAGSRLAAIRVLQKIGTEDSISRLKPLTEDRFAGQLAREAISAIEAAGRKPVDPATLDAGADSGSTSE
jgi:HEAT repeat protein